MQESRAQPDISVSKQSLTQSRSVGPSISDAVGAHRFLTDWRLTVRRVGREKRVSLMRSRHGAVGSLWVKTRGNQCARIGSALPQSSDVGSAHWHFVYVPRGDLSRCSN